MIEYRTKIHCVRAIQWDCLPNTLDKIKEIFGEDKISLHPDGTITITDYNEKGYGYLYYRDYLIEGAFGSHTIMGQNEFEDKYELHQECEEEGCKSRDTIQCVIPSGTNTETDETYDESYEYLCAEHAEANGFCVGCGEFIAGYKEFSNLCDNCEDQIENDFSDECDPDNEFYFEDDDVMPHEIIGEEDIDNES